MCVCVRVYLDYNIIYDPGHQNQEYGNIYQYWLRYIGSHNNHLFFVVALSTLYTAVTFCEK